MRIAQLANFYSPESGGLRVVVDRLAEGYLAAGHQRLLIVPGRRVVRSIEPSDIRVEVRSVPVPGSPYRLILRRRDVLRELERFNPDRVEVSDKSTLRWVGPWARRAGVPSVLVSHERLDAVVGVGPARRLSRRARSWSRWWAEAFDRIVCPSRFAAADFSTDVHDVSVVAWGVDSDRFVPRPSPPYEPIWLVWVGRLSPEKQPELAIRATEALRTRGLATRLTVVGDGPLMARLRSRAGPHVRFTGRLRDRGSLAELVAQHHVMLATSSVETFNLAALEGLACGLPVVCPTQGATRELVDDWCGAVVDGSPEGFADGVVAVMGDLPRRRAAARARSLRYDWQSAVDRMLAIHRMRPPSPAATSPYARSAVVSR